MAANPINPPSHLYSLEEYFALEHAGDARYEYWDGEVFCMSGGSLTHVRIAGNIYHAFRSKLTGSPCNAFTADLAVKTPTLPPYRYPDVSVVCGEPRVENIRGVDASLNPILIVEVISPTTESRDRGDKFAAYQQIASFQSYLLVAQNARLVSLYVRHPDGTWPSREFTGTEAVVQLD
ncbi:MAG: Uma2 family endonuclease, partial [Blastocatellia bacterium]